MKNWLTHNLKKRTIENRLPFRVEFNFFPFSPKSFNEESEQVCLDLYEKYGNKLFLAFSGGADSEYILKKFIELQLPIQPIIISCPYNQDDIQPGISYCEKNNISPIIVEYGKEYMLIAKEKIYKRGLLSPIGLAPLLVYEYVKDIGGKVITGQGEPMPITNKNGITDISKQIHMFEFEFYMEIHAEDEQPQPFFAYNQNIFYSYMKELDKSLDLEDAKCKLYQIKPRMKTYWSEEIYDSIRKHKKMSSGYSCKFDCETLQRQMQQQIIE